MSILLYQELGTRRTRYLNEASRDIYLENVSKFQLIDMLISIITGTNGKHCTITNSTLGYVTVDSSRHIIIRVPRNVTNRLRTVRPYLVLIINSWLEIYKVRLTKQECQQFATIIDLVQHDDLYSCLPYLNRVYTAARYASIF